MQELDRRGVSFTIISSGQNVLDQEQLSRMAGINIPYVVVNDRKIRKSPLALFLWFFETLLKGLFRLRSALAGRRTSVLIVHGDTVSTVMGAIIGKFYGLKVAHIEAGYRSFNFLQPFPEELDRYVTSFFADVHFCPYQNTIDNLKRRKGRKVNTFYNTNIDSLAYALQQPTKPILGDALAGEKFFIFILHRQENLLNKQLVRKLIDAVLETAARLKCVLVMHSLTRAVFEELGVLQSVVENENVVVVDRLPYFDFINLLGAAEFILTDGGGNQQESYYLGKPCLILRNVTEGTEGLGENVVLSKNDEDVIRQFIQRYPTYSRAMVKPDIRPSGIIADVLTSL